MRKTSLAIAIVSIVAIVFYFLIFSWLIPKTAMFGVPFKWRNMPVRESRTVARGYFGKSFTSDSSKEIWHEGSKGKMYRLELDYSDTVITGYSIRYTFSNSLLSRSYLLDSFSIK